MMDRRKFTGQRSAPCSGCRGTPPEARIVVQSSILGSPPDSHVQLASYNGIELVIDPKTAKALAPVIPKSLPLRAGEVTE